MATIHISAAEAARDFAAVLARVREGAEVVIEDEASPAVVLRAIAPPKGRSISEAIALAEAHAKELGYEPVMDSERTPRRNREGALSAYSSFPRRNRSGPFSDHHS